jgi:hypothetical protein
LSWSLNPPRVEQCRDNMRGGGTVAVPASGVIEADWRHQIGHVAVERP